MNIIPPQGPKLSEQDAPADELVAMVKHLSMMLNHNRFGLHAFLCAKDSEIVGMLAWLAECAKLPEAQAILLVMKQSAAHHGRRTDANVQVANIVADAIRKGRG